MLNRRVTINLVVFGLLGLIAAIWAVTGNVVSFDRLTHPYFITADFTDSPGLRPHFQVALQGVKVGQIASVSLAGHQAVVRLKIDHNIKLPANITAAARRQSAVGEPYVDLEPPPAYTGGGPYMKGGDVIPTSMTTTPLSYEDLFRALGALVQSVTPQDVHTLVHELAVGVGGRADTFRQLIENVNSISTTFAQNAPSIDQVIGDLTQLTQVLANHSASFGSGFDNLASLVSTLAQHRQTIIALLSNTPALLQQVNSILTSGGPPDSLDSLACLVNALGPVAVVLGTPPHPLQLADLVRLAPGTDKLFPKLLVTEPGVGLFLTGGGKLNFGQAPPNYNPPHTLGAPPAVPDCQAGAAGIPPFGPGASTGKGGPGGPVAGNAGPGTTQNVGLEGHSPGVLPSSSKSNLGKHWPVVVLAWLALLALLAVLGYKAARTWLPALIRRSSDG